MMQVSDSALDHSADGAETEPGGAEYLTFRIGDEGYGVDILKVQEIRGWEDVTRIPNAPTYVKGVLNLRGSIVPVFDLRLRLGMPFHAYDKETVVIVLRVTRNNSSRNFGVAVDSVSDVLSASTEDIRTPPNFGDKLDAELIGGLAASGDRMIMLLQVDKIQVAEQEKDETTELEV